MTIVDSKVYLIHQTAREYLICPDSSSSLIPETSPSVEWREPFDSRVSNFILTEICVFYLQLGDFADEQFLLNYAGLKGNPRAIRRIISRQYAGDESDDDGQSSNFSRFSERFKTEWEENLKEDAWDDDIDTQLETESEADTESEKNLESMDEFEFNKKLQHRKDTHVKGEANSGEDLIVEGKSYVFLGYAARYWAKHFKCAQSLAQPTLTATVAQITRCPLTHSSRIWRRIYNSYHNTELPAQASALILASWFGFHDVIKHCS